MATEWVKRWGYWISSEPVRPGIYRLQSSGYLVRARVTDPKTGKRPASFRALPEATLQEAQAELDRLVTERREGPKGTRPERQRFDSFAVSRFQAKLLAGDIKSAKGREKFESILRLHILPFFGAFRCDQVRAFHAEEWRSGLAIRMRDGYEVTRTTRSGKTRTQRVLLKPSTANTWIAVLVTLFNEMTDLLELPRNPGAALKPFDTSQHPTYTDEHPNSLTPDRARAFLTEFDRRFHQHYAMTLLGFVTGKRPSTLRPLRATGAEADIDWHEGFVRFRRSHTRGDEFMAGTKTGRYERVYLPETVLDALREHRALIAEPPLSARGKPPLWWRKPMAGSELLFPGRDGGPRSPSCLDKPFQVVSKAIGLPFVLTPRAMRRTCNDLCRAAKVDAVVTRSITGHLTEDMRIHYSTAQAAEQRAALAKVIDFVAVRKAVGS